MWYVAYMANIANGILTTVILLENWQQEFRVLIFFNTSDARTVVCVRNSFGIVLRENLFLIQD